MVSIIVMVVSLKGFNPCIKTKDETSIRSLKCDLCHLEDQNVILDQCGQFTCSTFFGNTSDMAGLNKTFSGKLHVSNVFNKQKGTS